jgi:hypothetical protein
LFLSTTMIGSTRESVGLTHAGPRLVLQCEVEAGEVEQPSCLVVVELLCNSKVFEVLVVRQDLNRMASPLKVVSPFFKALNHCKHFDIMDLIVAFDQTKCFGSE